MKRDMDLVRRIILAVEDHHHGFLEEEISIDGYSVEAVGYHQHLLIEAGLASGYDTSDRGSESPSARIRTLTWEGHEFADSARSESFWNTAKGKIKETAGAVSLAVLTEYLKYLGKQALGMS